MKRKTSTSQIKQNLKIRQAVFLLSTATCLLLLTARPIQAQRRADAFTIQWRGHVFQTNQPMAPRMEELTLTVYPETVKGYYLVQFTGPITKDMKQKVISAGGELHDYVPNNAFIVRMTAATRKKVEALQIVQSVTIYQPFMRLSQRLTNFITTGTRISPPKPRLPLELEKAPTPSAEPEPLHLTVTVFKGENLDTVRQELSKAGATVLETATGKRRSRAIVKIPRERALQLAKINAVKWIEEFRMPELHNNVARGIMNVETVWNNHGLRGNNQTVGVSDTGLDTGINDATMHDDFEGRINNIHSWPVQAGYGASNTGTDDGADDLDSGHGTHVAGSTLGNGTSSGGVFSGVAQAASLVFQAIEQYTTFPLDPDNYYLTGIPLNLNTLFQEAYDDGVRIHTNSWGGGNPGEYDALSEDVDEFVWDHPDMLILYSAGNDGADADLNNVVDLGSVTSPGTAKNCITVGASENNRPAINSTWSSRYGPIIDTDRVADNANGMAAFSSRGPANSDTAPTNDDRIKPDLVAPGTMIASTRSQAAPNTVWFTDDMESGINGWTTTGTWAQSTVDSHSPNTSWHDSPAGNYADNVNISLTSPVQNLSGGVGQGDQSIHFWCRYDLGSGDRWRLEASDDGGTTWPGSIEYDGTQANWELASIGLGPFAHSANFRVRFRLISDGDGNTGDGLYIDDVRIVEGAFGHSLLSDQGIAPAGSANDQNYMLMGGTSMSTPLTAGAAAIVRQYYTETVGVRYVSAALLRATLLNGAAEMNPGQYGTGANQEMGAKPNNVEGWGRVDLENSIFPTAPAVLSHVDELDGLETGESSTYDLVITDNSVPVAITMVYHDFPSAALTNHLDLTVSTPAGATLFPNNLTNTDTQNNVEQILIPAAQVQTGTYTITINAPSVPEGPQPYALAISAGGTIPPRNPVDVTMVLDLSGSMLSNACPTCDPKLDVLQDAVELFVQLWTAVAVPTDRIGTIYFKTNVSEFDIGGDVLLPVLPNAEAIITDVQNQNTVPANLTAMGGGIQRAINLLTDATRPRSIVVFTDGMQNVNPMITLPPGPYDIYNEPGRTNSNISPTTPPTRLDTTLGRKVNTIGVGALGSYMDLLNNIATATNGVSKFTTAPDDDLRRFFVEELIDVLRDYSPQLIAYRHNNLNGLSGTETFAISNAARKLILKLSWKKPNMMSFGVEKDGVDVTKFGRIISNPNNRYYRIFVLDLPLVLPEQVIGAGGQWKMKITGRGTNAPYEVAAIVDEPSLEYELSLGQKDYRVGDSLELNVRLSIDGKPLTDAQHVTAVVRTPQQSVGTLLSVTPNPANLASAQAPELATIAQRKLQTLMQDKKFFDAIQPVNKQITLHNNGDGSYSASFSNTKVPGVYTVIFHIEGQRPDIGSYTRTEAVSTRVTFGKAALKASDLRVIVLKESDDGKRLQLTLRPKDKYGNYLGPEYGHRIGITLSSGSITGELSDPADGSYSATAIVPPNVDPRLTVTVMDHVLYEGRLSKTPGKSAFKVSAHAGMTSPLGSFSNHYSQYQSYILDLEYPLTQELSLVGLLGYNEFNATSTGYDDIYIINLSANLKYCRPLKNKWSAYIAGGPGYYLPEDYGSGIGANLSIGFDYEFKNDILLEVGSDYHSRFDNDMDFLVTRVGLIFSF
jgi:subtilisin family serine protease